MNKEKLFTYLKEQPASELLELLDACYCHMKTGEIQSVFGDLEDKFLAEAPSDGEEILNSVQKFIAASLNGDYYAPFDINSKNFMNVPEETDMWFEKLAELLTESLQLSQQGDHISAVKCFGALYELIDTVMASGELVFADELGMWMLPIRQEPCIKAYLESAAAILEPEEYVEVVDQLSAVIHIQEAL